MKPPIEIDDKHLLWRAIATSDDDWGGSTATNFVHSYMTDVDVIIYPPENCSPQLLSEVYMACHRVAKSVIIYSHKPS